MEMWSGLSSRKLPFAHFLSSHARTMQACQGLHIGCSLYLEQLSTSMLCSNHLEDLPPNNHLLGQGYPDNPTSSHNPHPLPYFMFLL